MFAVTDSILLRPLPFPESDRLVTIFKHLSESRGRARRLLVDQLLRAARHIPAFSSLSIFREGTEVVGETGSTQQEKVLRVSPDFFTTLGARGFSRWAFCSVMGAWAAGKAMQSVLFGVPTLHPATLFGTALVMVGASLVACLILARRASRVDPMIALRAE